MTARLTTQMSTKGQVVLPKAVRERRGWRAGEELIVEERPEGVLLRSASKTAWSQMDDIFGSLGPVDRAFSLDEMNVAMLDEAARRWRRKGFARD